MGPERGISIPASETKPFYTPEGSKVGPVDILDKPKVLEDFSDPGSTSIHEWWHAWIGKERGIGIDGVEVKNRGRARGTTYPVMFDGPTAAAGHASGTGGEGYDFFLIRMHGLDPLKESAKASAMAKGHEEEIMLGAGILEKKKYFTKTDVNTTHIKVKNWLKDRDNKKTQVYEIPIKTKDGKEETVRLEVPKGATMLHVPLPQSGDIYVAQRNTFYSESAKDF